MGELIQDNTKFFYIVGLRNAHAVETQAVELLSRQAERIENYPEIKAKLQTHLAETKLQRSRLEEILNTYSESASLVKEAVLGFGGNIAALAHMSASDEIIKNTVANYMFEHFEIATYEALVVMAEAMGDASAVAALRQSLQEEEAMAGWLREHIAPTTSKFLERTKSGLTADH